MSLDANPTRQRGVLLDSPWLIKAGIPRWRVGFVWGSISSPYAMLRLDSLPWVGRRQADTVAAASGFADSACKSLSAACNAEPRGRPNPIPLHSPSIKINVQEPVAVTSFQTWQSDSVVELPVANALESSRAVVVRLSGSRPGDPL